MKKARITRVSPGHELEDQTDWTRVKKMTPEDIRTGVDSNCPTTEPGDWDQAMVKSGVRGPKQSVRKNTEVKVRFGSLEEKNQILSFIPKQSPELSLNAFFKRAAREKSQRESS